MAPNQRLNFIFLLLTAILIGSVCSCQIGNTIYSRNGRYSANITLCAYPSNESEIVSLITLANKNNASIRAIGKSHSGSAVGMMDNSIHNNLYLLNLSANMTEIIDINLEEMTMTFEAGCSQNDVFTELANYNLSIIADGGPPSANFVGSALTGTHGSHTLANPQRNFASNIIALRLVTGNGTIIAANNTYNKDIFDAARVSFGALGIISQVTIKVQPMQYRTVYPQWNISNLSTYSSTMAAANYIFNLYDNTSFVHAWLQFFDEAFTVDVANIVDINSDDDIYNDSCWLTGIKPCTDVYYHASIRYATVDWDPPVELEKFHEAEFFVDQSIWREAYSAVVDWIMNENKLKQSKLWNDTYQFYMEHGNALSMLVRFTSEDDIWLSPAYKRNVTQISIYSSSLTPNQPRLTDSVYDEWVYGVYRVLKQFDDSLTFHWAKDGRVSYIDLKESYPMIDEFVALQKELDPNQIFVNQFIIDKLGLCNVAKQCCCTDYSCSVEEKCVDEETKDNNNWIWIVGIVVGVVLCIVLIGWMLVKRRKNKEKINDNDNNMTYLTMMGNTDGDHKQ